MTMRYLDSVYYKEELVNLLWKNTDFNVIPN
jgi:hypothetical protein